MEEEEAEEEKDFVLELTPKPKSDARCYNQCKPDQDATINSSTESHAMF